MAEGNGPKSLSAQGLADGQFDLVISLAFLRRSWHRGHAVWVAAHILRLVAYHLGQNKCRYQSDNSQNLRCAPPAETVGFGVDQPSNQRHQNQRADAHYHHG
jgi:hypothetical protein